MLFSAFSEITDRIWPTFFIGIVVALWAYFEMRRKRIDRALIIFSWSLFLWGTGLAFYFGGIQAPILYVLPLCIMICAWVQGRWPALAMSVLAIGALCFLVVGQQNGWWMQLPQRLSTQILITYCSVIGVVAVIAVLIAEHLQELSAHERRVSNELKKQVASLAQSQKSLIERGAELELALVRLQESHEQLASSEARATLSTLIASVSHELGAPIGNGVMMASTLTDQARDFERLLGAGDLKRSDLARFVASQTEGNAMVLGNLNRASELLTSFRQVAADQASEQRREFDLVTVIREILSTLTPTTKRYPHRVNLEIPDGILMDSLPGPLGQVVINLINNAYLHAFEGRTHGVVTVIAQADGEDVTLYFRDNGVGIPPDNLARLFEPFFSTKIGKGGTGLGMAIVQNLVTKTLGGTISVSSVLGGGTSFEIRLPRVMANV